MKPRLRNRALILNTARSVWIAMSVSHCVLPQIRREGDGATTNDQAASEDVPSVEMDQPSVDVPTVDQGIDVPNIDIPSVDVVCRATETACNGRCANLQTDPNNCGGCARSCTAPVNATPKCNNTMCAYDCDPGFRVSGNSCAADCTSPQQNCSPSFTCNGSEGCASIRVIRVPWDQLARGAVAGAECNLLRATTDRGLVWQDCAWAASRYCQQPAIGAHFGFGPVSWSDAGAEIACVFNPAANLASRPQGEFGGCVTDGSEACAATTNAICAVMRAGTRGWQPYSRNPMTVSSGCFGNALVVETPFSLDQLAPMMDRPTCSPLNAFTSVGCMLAAHNACRAQRFVSGVGPIRPAGPPNQWVFYCLREKPPV